MKRPFKWHIPAAHVKEASEQLT